MVADIPRLTARQGANAPEVARSIEQHFLSSVTVMYAGLRAAERDAEAQVVLAELRTLMPGDAIADTMKKAGVLNAP